MPESSDMALALRTEQCRMLERYISRRTTPVFSIVVSAMFAWVYGVLLSPLRAGLWFSLVAFVAVTRLVVRARSAPPLWADPGLVPKPAVVDACLRSICIGTWATAASWGSA